MSNKGKPKVVRTNSTPVIIPGKRRSEMGRKLSVGTPSKSILVKRDTSLTSSPSGSHASTPYGTPEVSYPASFPKRKTSQVRFSSDNLETPEKYLFEKEGISKEGQSMMSRYRNRSIDNDSANDSLNEMEGSRDSDEYSNNSDSPLPSKISTSMSTEAQYATLQTYEEELYIKISQTFPQVLDRLEGNSYHSSHHTGNFPSLDDLDDCTSNSSTTPHSEQLYKVAQRIQKAMDILDSVRQYDSEQKTSNKTCSNRCLTKNTVKHFDKWCLSLRDVLDEIHLAQI